MGFRASGIGSTVLALVLLVANVGVLVHGIKLVKKSEVAVGETTASLVFSRKFNPCKLEEAGTLVVCAAAAAGVDTTALKMTVNEKEDISLKAIPKEANGSEAVCYEADPCTFWTAKACGSTDTVKLQYTVASALTNALSISAVYSGRYLATVEDTKAVVVDSVTSVIVPPSLVCSAPQFSAIKGTADQPQCASEEGTQIAALHNHKPDTLASFTSEDESDDETKGTPLTVTCKANSASTSTSTAGTGGGTVTTSSGVTRVSSVSSMLAAAAITTVGVMAVSGH